MESQSRNHEERGRYTNNIPRKNGNYFQESIGMKSDWEFLAASRELFSLAAQDSSRHLCVSEMQCPMEFLSGTKAWKHSIPRISFIPDFIIVLCHPYKRAAMSAWGHSCSPIISVEFFSSIRNVEFHLRSSFYCR